MGVRVQQTRATQRALVTPSGMTMIRLPLTPRALIHLCLQFQKRARPPLLSVHSHEAFLTRASLLLLIKSLDLARASQSFDSPPERVLRAAGCKSYSCHCSVALMMTSSRLASGTSFSFSLLGTCLG